MIRIVQKEDPILRAIAKPVPREMFGSPQLAQILANMKEAIASQDDAVAIAAPQIGVPYRIFVVSGRVFELLGEDGGHEEHQEHTEHGEHEEHKEHQTKMEDIVFINPEIVKLSKERRQVEEGCLSVRYLYGKISRARKAKVRAYDERGRAFEIGGSGLIAQIFQHETDHLDGKLFIDEAVELEDLPPEEHTARRSKKIA
ncbi:MAG TPA: peptide deformylase [Candidatus Paceibacterota bacterium]|nr:peptide deformylase [Candidatus Paceibacterota bacterium]